MNFASICSGIGAPEVAWKDFGWEQLFAAEIEKFPNAVHSLRFPKVQNYGDITKFKEWPEHSIDVLVGGTPCQSFSVAGLRKGLADPRGNLALTFLAIVKRYSPTWVLWENVPGVLSSDSGEAFGAFLGGLAILGYGFAYRILDAQYFNLAQRRERVFVVGCAGGQWQRAAQVLFERQSMCWHPAPSRETGKRVAPTVEGRAGRSGCNNFATSGGLQEIAATLRSGSNGTASHGKINRSDRMELIPVIANTVRTMSGGIDNEDSHTIIAHCLRAEFDASEDGTGRGIPLVPLAFSSKDHGADAGELSPTIRASSHDKSHASGGAPPAIAFQPRIARNGRGDMGERVNALNAQSGKTGKGDAAPCVAFHQNQRAEVTTNETAGSLKVGGGKPGQGYPAIQQGWAVRRLTPRECERLQGFPDDWTLIPWRGKPAEQCPDGPRYKAIGNSMAVPVLRWIGQRIKALG